jgi:hypothetical protein
MDARKRQLLQILFGTCFAIIITSSTAAHESSARYYGAFQFDKEGLQGKSLGHAYN